jgi:hypothetical protein
MKKSPRKLLLSRETLLSLEPPTVGMAGGVEAAPPSVITWTGDSCDCTFAQICFTRPSGMQVVCTS